MSGRPHHPIDRISACLTGIELVNFKSVPKCNVRIGPLTVVTGANSSGKSSLLQAVLALSQVSRRRIDGGRFPLNDDLVQLGTFAALRHQGEDQEGPVAIISTFTCLLPEPGRFPSGYGQVVEFDRRKGTRPLSVDVGWTIEMDSSVTDQVGSAQISAVGLDVRGDNIDISVRVDRTSELPDDEDMLPVSLDAASVYCGIFSAGSTGTNVLAATLRSGRLRRIFGEPLDPSRAPELVREWLSRVERQGNSGSSSADADIWDIGVETAMSYIEVAAYLARFDLAAPPELAEWYATLDDTSRESLAHEIVRALQHDVEFRRAVGWESLVVSGLVPAAQQECASFLASSVRYVGPLRQSPHLPFSTAPDPDAGDVGVSGEYVAAVLQAKRSTSGQYPLPPGDARPDSAEGRLELTDALNRWLGYLGLADAMSVSEDTPLVLGISVTPPALTEPVPLGSVGVGVSQVLPILVQCLVAGPGALIILEQPELHLHPAAQQRLADFLIACTNWGQRFLVESHSEHLVLRLRRRIAEDESDALRHQVVILFAERDEQGDTAYRHVEVTETGGVTEWPEGFFDQGPDDAHRLLVAAASRQNQASD